MQDYKHPVSDTREGRWTVWWRGDKACAEILPLKPCHENDEKHIVHWWEQETEDGDSTGARTAKQLGDDG